MYNADPKTYELEMSDGTTITVEDVNMEQKYGFLVFSDADGNRTFGVRAENIETWTIKIREVKPPAVTKVVTAKVTRAKK